MIEFLSALSLYTCLILGIVVLWMIILFLADCSLGKTKSIYQIAKVVLWKYKANDDWGRQLYAQLKEQYGKEGEQRENENK